ncbi:hypothetical protein [Bacillus norwichensis]|uniref:Uncharacterized protein n=1 Tax=Bacillus norwichensis TaxID=2762217 RepID=A0ABR8VIF0_9BACI|nr:hypothetical protein [Bacillus norwichensis]MBD8004558.1 hypothetical protein [Bacillus norwichensis]
MKTPDLTNHQVNYSNGLLNTQRMILMNDFIMESNLEDQYLHHLNTLRQQDGWAEFHPIIEETIQEYQITDYDIQHAISDFIRVPAFC